MNKQEQTHSTEASNQELSALLHRSMRLMMRAHHQLGHREHAQMRVLHILQHNGPISQKSLQENMQLRSSSLSELLQKLEQRGLITRTRDEEDKRNIIITITREGANLHDAHAATSAKSAEVIFGALSGEEREQMASGLNKIIASLSEHVSEHHGHECNRRKHGKHGHGHHGHGGHERHIMANATRRDMD